MYAVIDDRGHQYKVAQGDRFDVQLMDLAEGQDHVDFDRVLLVGDTGSAPKVGTPVVAGAKVTAKIIERLKGDKIVIQKFRRRKNYRRKTGHRQQYLRLQVESITV